MGRFSLFLLKGENSTHERICPNSEKESMSFLRPCKLHAQSVNLVNPQDILYIATKRVEVWGQRGLCCPHSEGSKWSSSENDLPLPSAIPILGLRVLSHAAHTFFLLHLTALSSDLLKRPIKSLKRAL